MKKIEFGDVCTVRRISTLLVLKGKVPFSDSVIHSKFVRGIGDAVCMIEAQTLEWLL